MDHVPDQVFLAAKSGDVSALNNLLTIIEDYVRTVVRNHLGKSFRSEVDVDDCCQEVLFQISRDLPDCKASDFAAFKGWVAVVARNVTYKIIEKCSALKRGANRIKTSIERDIYASATPAADRKLEAKEELEFVMNTARDRGSRVLQLVEMISLGYTAQEIAKELDTSVNNVWTMACRFRSGFSGLE